MAHDRDDALALIRSNIGQHGYHVYGVRGGTSPDYHYTIGLSPRLGAEVIIAGASYFSPDQQLDVLREVSKLPGRLDASGTSRTMNSAWGDFEIALADPSWSAQLALGVFDYYQRDIAVWAISPTGESRTIDVPEMTVPWQADAQRAWRWLGEQWPYEIPTDASVVTDLRAMRGEAVTDGLRRTETDWELFVDADPDQPQEGVFIVPFGTLLGFDPTLAAFTQLAVGEGLTRKPGGVWMPRRTRN